MRQFSVRNLLVLTLVVCLVLAFLSQEPIEIALAALFCCISAIGASILICISGNHLFKLIKLAIQSRNIRVLTQRFWWIHLDGLIIGWLVIGFSVSNFVIENSIGNAGRFVLYGWAVGPLLVVAYWIGSKMIANRRDSAGS